MSEVAINKKAFPLHLEGRRKKAVLIIHGYTGYPGEFYELAHALNSEGYRVSLPRLPGHGTNKSDFLKTGWKDWLNHIKDAYSKLEAEYSSVSIVGLSMGGVLALILAAEFNPDRIALLAPAMAVKSRTFYLSPLLKYFRKEIPKQWNPLPTDGPDIKELGREYWSYNFPGQLANLYKLIRIAGKSLKKVHSPTVIMLSELDDSVPVNVGPMLEKKLVKCPVKNIILKKSPHVLVSGEEKEYVKKEVIQWITQGDNNE